MVRDETRKSKLFTGWGLTQPKNATPQFQLKVVIKLQQNVTVIKTIEKRELDQTLIRKESF